MCIVHSVKAGFNLCFMDLRLGSHKMCKERERGIYGQTILSASDTHTQRHTNKWVRGEELQPIKPLCFRPHNHKAETLTLRDWQVWGGGEYRGGSWGVRTSSLHIIPRTAVHCLQFFWVTRERPIERCCGCVNIPGIFILLAIFIVYTSIKLVGSKNVGNVSFWPIWCNGTAAVCVTQ